MWLNIALRPLLWITSNASNPLHSPAGIETDLFENEDKFLLHFWNMVKSSLGQEAAPYVQTILENIDGKTVCRVKCMRSPSPVFLKQKRFDEECYIGVGPGSASLDISEALKYIAERFPKQNG